MYTTPYASVEKEGKNLLFFVYFFEKLLTARIYFDIMEAVIYIYLPETGKEVYHAERKVWV